MKLVITPETLSSPLMQFPGDELIPPDAYQACMTNNAQLAVATCAAANKLGVDLDGETVERWKRIGAAGVILDHFLDETPDRSEAIRTFQHMMAFGSGRAEMPAIPVWASKQVEPTVSLVTNALGTLEPPRRDTVLAAASLIAAISCAKAECSDVRRYQNLLVLEGCLSAVLVTESVSDAVYAQPAFEAWAAWAVAFLETGTLIDHAIDLENDFRAGLTQVRPSRLNSFRLAWQARQSARFLIHAQNMAALRAGINAKRAFRRKGPS